jgi:hypothetical protein
MVNNKFTTKNLEENNLKLYCFDILSPYTKEFEPCQILDKIGKRESVMQEDYQQKIDTFYDLTSASKTGLDRDDTINWMKVEEELAIHKEEGINPSS